MWTLSEKLVTARKQHRCCASERILEINFCDDFTEEEMKLVEKARQPGGCTIQTGQQYVRHVYVEAGEIYTYRALPEMDAIAAKYDMWWEE